MSSNRPPAKRAKTSHAPTRRQNTRTPLDEENDIWDVDHEAELEALRESEKAPPLVSGTGMNHSAWSRAPCAKLDPSKDVLEIMQVDASEALQPKNDGSAVIHLFGLTREGASVLLHVENFHHYFYIPAALKGISKTSLRNALEEHLKVSVAKDANRARFLGNGKNSNASLVVDIDIVKKRSIMNYIPGDPELSFFKVTFRHPRLIRYARDIFRRGGLEVEREGVDGKFRLPSQPTFEATLDYVLRFMIEIELAGCAWLTVPKNKYKLKVGAQKRTHAQIEAVCDADDIIAHKPEGKWLETAPIRRLSFDIECAGRKGVFPEPEHDSVIQIANYVVDHGNDKTVAKVVLTLDSCAPIVGAKVLSYKTEEEMLAAWSKFMVASDPDVLTGYNIVNFDLPYLIDRAKKLDVTEFPFLGRLTGQRTTMRNTKMSSSAFGTHESKAFTIHGRVIYDMLQLITREYKLRSYSLNSVSAEFLGEQKEDVHYSIISDLQGGDEQTRRRLAVYCLKDAYLPIRLMDKLMFLTNYSEMARVTGIPLGWLVSRGHMVKVVSLLHKKAHISDLLIPDIERRAQGGDGDGGPQFEGATVIEPKKGYYSEPIATLDFASLYPSIIQAHNLCYSTLVRPEHISKLKQEDLEKTPTGSVFVKRHVKQGILTTMLEELLTARKKAKRALKNASKLLDAAQKLKDAEEDLVSTKELKALSISEASKNLEETMKAQDEKDRPDVEELKLKVAVINGRQLALKISANAIYGFTGASVGKLPCMEISASTTAYGREMIELTKKEVEKRYESIGADVVYGDTDSVMIRFGKEKSLEECMKLGEQAADAISSIFPKPVRLEFEKCYYPYLLISKKRYAGLLWTNTKKHDKMDCKGIESVRRDNCRLVANIIDSVLKLLLEKRDKESAVNIVKSVISDLLQNKIDISLLVVSKALSKMEYDNKQPHVELAEKLRKRDAGTAPSIGDRVPYVIIKGTKNEPAYSRAEDPLYVLENNLPIDNNYYLENMLRKPLERIFEPIMKSQTSSLFAGEHTRKVKVVKPKTGGMLKFAKVQLTCLGCKAPIKSGAVCQYCLSKEGDIYMKNLEVVTDLERNYSSLWTECQRCMGDICHDVLCSNGDCPIFYRRRKVQKDLDDAMARMQRFSLEW